MASSESGFRARSETRFLTASPCLPAAICWLIWARALWYRPTSHSLQPPRESAIAIKTAGSTSRHHRRLVAATDRCSSSTPCVSINTRPRIFATDRTDSLLHPVCSIDRPADN